MTDPSDDRPPQSLLFVCSGNICRSPSAEGVMRKLLDDAGLAQVRTGSVGTGGWHVGDPPDKRARDAAGRRGYDLSPLRAEQLADWHFQDFDRLFAMDLGHLRHMRARVSAPLRSRVRLYLAPLDPEITTGREVPDPYYGDLAGFERALDIVEAGARAILAALQAGRL